MKSGQNRGDSMRYKHELGLFGNINALFKEATRIDTKSEQAEMEIMANMVESVIDEFHAFVGEEE